MSKDDAHIDYISVLDQDDLVRRFSEDIVDLDTRNSLQLRKLYRQIQRQVHCMENDQVHCPQPEYICMQLGLFQHIVNVAWTTRNAVFEESESKPISKTGTLKISGNHLERKSSVKMTTLPSRRTRSSPPPPTPTLLPSRRSSRLRSQSVTVYKFKEDECQSFTNNKQQRSQSLRLQIPDNSVLSGKFLI